MELELVDVVVEQFGDQVDVCEDHSPAAVPIQTKLVESEALGTLLRCIVTVCVLTESSLLISLVLIEEVDVLVVLVACDLFL